MLALVIVVAMVAFSLAYVVDPRMHAFASLAYDFSVKVSCDAFGAWGLVRAVIAAVAANQAVFLISPRKSQLSDDKRSVRGNDNRK